ncbi:hypothetical protein PS896_03948 [Pseudomonas fluorescens]|uniref:Uncharacterized protein n=1 Tax=Pseudomonas fluorescens TaxID=294 RepID=A0A5E7MEI1_PSEFL|nr:hypothetical protein [Pseudomonas fluorescens]VVP23148.1 hypothetical protein PS896_03948 [Pseudomonas fluorescens]
MNESQVKEIEEIVQQVAVDSGVSFDAAFKIAVGVLRLHAIERLPKGDGCAGGPI